ncbi:MAG: acetate--CoA ligase [Proteobacteria bacterium]|nr:acetate--CoA ligase [Pseudomonadota bacterium]
MSDTSASYDAHLAEFQKVAYVNSRRQYDDMYRRSIEEPEAFWAEQARDLLSFDRKWDSVLEYDFDQARVAWFGGARLNASYNCLDRHLGKSKDKVALYFEGDDPNQAYAITYLDLFERVNKFAGVLRKQGVGRGDRVVIYLPMIPELPVAMLACARIGAVHSVVFGGFSAESLAGRITDCGAKLVVTADGGFRAGKVIALKKNVDQAVGKTGRPLPVVVCERAGLGIELERPREVWWHEAVADPELPGFIAPESMDAEDPLFILYTSGSTGRPKGVVHTHAGYLLYAALTTKLTFDLKPDETWWCTADIGWITGHTYIVYGPLAGGFTGVLFEGVPSYPGFDRLWQVIEKYKVDKFYTAPTVIRSVAKQGADLVEKHDVSSLKLLGSVGEPINPEAWRWYYRHVGRNVCPIMDTWWQTETGGHMLTPLPGVAPIKPGSCSFPFFGVDPVILDPDTGEEARFPNQEGALCIRRPWPGMARTLFGDHERFREVYFSRVAGMYFTGDGAKQDEEGYFWITGRIDDVINVSGHRLGTAEIESALVAHPAAAEAAVVGYPHPVKGQGIYAFVTLNAGVAKSDGLKRELVQMVRAEIGTIATPDVIQWADALPKTRSGKIMRRILQKVAAGRIDELGDTSTLADPGVLDRIIAERIGVADEGEG